MKITRKMLVSALVCFLLVGAGIAAWLWFGVSEKEASNTSVAPFSASRIMHREEIRYTITIQSKDRAHTVGRFVELTKKLGFGQSSENVDPLKDNTIDVPRTRYLEFLEALQKMGKLNVERERFMTDTPSDRPVPFVIRFTQE